MGFNKLKIAKPSSDTEFNFPVIGCYLIPLFYFIGTIIYVTERFGKIYVSGYYLIHYFYTYDHGYVARGLIGEVLSHFFDTLNDEQLADINLFLNVCFALSCTLFVGRALQSVRKDKYRFSVICLIVLIFFVFAAPVRFYSADPKLDKNLWTLAFIAVVLAQHRLGIYLVPVICVIATMINPVFLFCSMILVSIILLQEFFSSGFSVKNGIICAVSYISMIAAALYGTLSIKAVNFTTPAELIDFYFSRYEGVLSEDVYHLFETEWLFDYFDPAATVVRKAFEIYFVEWDNGIRTALHFTLVALPAYILITMFWKRVIKLEENKPQKFIYFLCAIAPLVILIPVILSWEFSKYFYNNIFVEAGLVIYFVTNKFPAVLTVTKEIEALFKKHIFLSLIIAFYFILFISIFSIA